MIGALVKRKRVYDEGVVKVDYYLEAIDEFGAPVERTKADYPYSYDGFVTWRGGKNEAANDTIYSDHLGKWNREKRDALLLKHFGDTGDYYDNREPAKIEAFLRDFLDKPALKLVFVMEYCNVANGYPYWRFDVAR